MAIYSDASDEGLANQVALAVRGDEAAFTRIVRAHHDDMTRVCFIVCGDVDIADEAVQDALAEQRLGRSIMTSPLPELNGVAERSYDLIGAFDVIEHIEEDGAAIAAIAARLRPGGKLVMTVPAHQWMWSAHDVVNHHKRRYSKAGLRMMIEGSPLRLDKLGYFNSLLFPAALAERLSSKLRGKDSADLKLPIAPLNTALERVFAAERHLVGRLPLPPGLSLFAVASAR